MPGETTRRLHPLLAAAAVAVIVFAGVGVAALTGVLPISRGAPAPTESTSAQPESGLAAAAKTATAAKNTVAAKPALAARTASRSVAYARAPERAVRRAPVRAVRREPVRLAAARPRCLSCGVVEGVRVVEVKGKGTGLGAVAGGVAGALLGNQMGNGNGRTVMTLVGAAGGAFAGNAIEKKARSTKHWDVDVRLTDGRSQVIAYKAQPPWRAGDHVRVVNGTLQPN